MPEPIEELFVSIGSDVSELMDDMKELRKDLDKLEKELKDTEKTSKTTFTRMGDFAKKAGAAIVGLVATIGTLIAGIKKATDAAVEAEKAYVNLATSVGAANREFGQGVGTVESWEKNIKSLQKELRIFSETELQNASSRLVDMTKRLGLTEDQMLTLLRRTADLSAGKVDLVGGIERVTAAMRGEAESAEFLGLSLNENTVKAYAEAQGLVWKNLTDTEKATQRYNLFLEQTNELQGRAAVFAESLAGQEAALTAELENQSVIIGESLLPLRQGYLEALKVLTTETETSSSIINRALAALAAGFGTAILAIQANSKIAVGAFGVLQAAGEALINLENPIDAAAEATRRFGDDVTEATTILTNLPSIAQDSFNQILQGWEEQREAAKEAATAAAGAGGGSLLGPTVEATREDAEELQKILDSVGSELLDLQERTNADLEAAAMEHAAAMAQIEQEAAAERLEINEKFDQMLVKRQQDIIQNAREDLERLSEQTADRIAKIRRRNDTEELREAEDHFEEMRRLRLDYLDNLDDAVKNRDARALVDLRKKFEREQSETQRNFDIQRSRRDEDASQEINDLIESENRQAQEIIERRQQALAEVEEEVRASRARELVELEENLAEAKATEQTNFDERRIQLESALTERLEMEAKALADMEDINAEGAEAVLGTLAEYFGVGGEIDQLMENFANRRRQKLTIQIDFDENLNAASQSSSINNRSAPSIQAFQTGGTLIARQPTLAQFGEVPELVQFTPLSKLAGSNAANIRPDQVDLNLSLTVGGSAPPGMGKAEIDRMAGMLVNALRQAGIDATPPGR